MVLVNGIFPSGLLLAMSTHLSIEFFNIYANIVVFECITTNGSQRKCRRGAAEKNKKYSRSEWNRTHTHTLMIEWRQMNHCHVFDEFKNRKSCDGKEWQRIHKEEKKKKINGTTGANKYYLSFCTKRMAMLSADVICCALNGKWRLFMYALQKLIRQKMWGVFSRFSPSLCCSSCSSCVPLFCNETQYVGVVEQHHRLYVQSNNFRCICKCVSILPVQTHHTRTTKKRKNEHVNTSVNCSADAAYDPLNNRATESMWE